MKFELIIFFGGGLGRIPCSQLIFQKGTVKATVPFFVLRSGDRIYGYRRVYAEHGRRAPPILRESGRSRCRGAIYCAQRHTGTFGGRDESRPYVRSNHPNR